MLCKFSSQTSHEPGPEDFTHGFDWKKELAFIPGSLPFALLSHTTSRNNARSGLNVGADVNSVSAPRYAVQRLSKGYPPGAWDHWKSFASLNILNIRMITFSISSNFIPVIQSAKSVHDQDSISLLAEIVPSPIAPWLCYKCKVDFRHLLYYYSSQAHALVIADTVALFDSNAKKLHKNI